jgi:ribulose-phosphate 3-epimerase
MTMYLIAPSILAADFLRLGEQIAQVEAAGADWIHIDVMDGHFVPNLTMGPFIVEHCRRATRLPLDVHLMVTEPMRFVEAFVRAGANSLTVHVEANDELRPTLQKIRSLGCRAGLSLSPGTPAEAVHPYLGLVDLILVMSVEPGYAGQQFLPQVLPKIAAVRRMLDVADSSAWLQVDGGLSPTTLPQVKAAGANVFVAAQAIFHHPDGIAAGLRALRESLQDNN